MAQTHFHFHVPRKIWHVCATLAMLPIYFGIIYLSPENHVLISFIIAWMTTVILIFVDIIRMYQPGANEVILKMPLLKFFRLIWRDHEHTGYAASTYSVIAVTLAVSMLYFGLIGEFAFVALILVMALCDPFAAAGRLIMKHRRPIWARPSGFLFFAGSALTIQVILGLIYGKIDWDVFLVAAVSAAIAEVWFGHIWLFAIKPIRWLGRLLEIDPPLWISSFFPDDNLTAPIALVMILMLFGY